MCAVSSQQFGSRAMFGFRAMAKGWGSERTERAWRYLQQRSGRPRGLPRLSQDGRLRKVIVHLGGSYYQRLTFRPNEVFDFERYTYVGPYPTMEGAFRAA